MPERILVIGTTPDYIEWLHNACPEKAFFLTDAKFYKDAQGTSFGNQEELVIPLDSFDHIENELIDHLQKWDLSLSGITCFDCEFLDLTARLASRLGLEYHSSSTIQNCRDKYYSKILWQKKGLPCPEAIPVNSEMDACQFLIKNPNGIVLKPFCGGGSELVFKCSTPKECKKSFKIIKSGLKNRETSPLFKKAASIDHLMVAEQFIAGPEYSSDFILENNTVKIIRLARKIKFTEQVFGTASGYILVESLPQDINMSEFKKLLFDGATALGIQKGICMVDFILEGKRPVLIEITPRPGGDCIPFLLKEAGNIDILELALDFAEQKSLEAKNNFSYKPLIGLRIHAQKAGKLKGFDTTGLENEKRIKKLHFIRKPGHIITMPPADYDSWLLGHIIIEPDAKSFPETQCLLIKSRIGMEIE